MDAGTLRGQANLGLDRETRNRTVSNTVEVGRPGAEIYIDIIDMDPRRQELNTSLTNMMWLTDMSGKILVENCQKDQHVPAPESIVKENALETGLFEKPPYSYLQMIQLAINSAPDKRKTLQEIYTWIETNFPYYAQTSKKGWKNSIRHNLSIYDIFERNKLGSGTGKKLASYWSLRADSKTHQKLLKYDKPKPKYPAPMLPKAPPGVTYVPVSVIPMAFVGLPTNLKRPLDGGSEPSAKKHVQIAPNNIAVYDCTNMPQQTGPLNTSDSSTDAGSNSCSVDSGIDIKLTPVTAEVIKDSSEKSKWNNLSHLKSEPFLSKPESNKLHDPSLSENEVNDMLNLLGMNLSPHRTTQGGLVTSTPFRNQLSDTDKVFSPLRPSNNWIRSSMYSPTSLVEDQPSNKATPKSNRPKLTSSPVRPGALRDLHIEGLTPLRSNDISLNLSFNQSWLNDMPFENITIEEPTELSIKLFDP